MIIRSIKDESLQIAAQAATWVVQPEPFMLLESNWFKTKLYYFTSNIKLTITFGRLDLLLCFD